MRNNYILLFIFLLSFVSNAQQKFNFKKAKEFTYKTQQRSSQQPVSPLSSPFSDTLNQYFDDNWGPAELDTYMFSYDSGYIAGTNYMGVTATMERYKLPVGGTLNSILFGFGKAVGTGNFNVTMWVDNAGVPGSVLQTFTTSISQTDTVFHTFNHFVALEPVLWNYAANLPIPITFTPGASFWAGIQAINNPGDTIALLSTMDGSTTSPSHINDVGMIYEGSFLTYNAAIGYDILFCMFPVISYPPCAINGTVYNDVNSNNIKDAGDTAIANVKVTAGNFIGFTNLNGAYTVYADSGNYNLTASVQYATENPTSINVSLPTGTSISNANDFATHYIPGIRDVSIKMIADPFRPGFGGDYLIYVQNNGTQTDSGTVSITLDDSLQYDWAEPSPFTISGNTLTFNYPAIDPGQNTSMYVSVNVPADLGINYPLMSSGSVTPLLNDSNTVNNYDTSRIVTVASYDPNEKSVSPAGNISPEFVNTGNYLYYTIHFQNTGTDTAININVIDTLSAMLDVTSFEALTSSHHYTTSIKDNSIITFQFNNILLLDSGQSQPKSNGYISYRIKPKSNLSIGSTIKNTAYIYFDFNAPVITETTITEVSAATTSINKITSSSAQNLQVFPNPFKNDLTLLFNESGNYTIKIFDVLGETKLNTSIKNSKMYNIDLSNFSTGYYVITAEGAKGIYRTKVVKQ